MMDIATNYCAGVVTEMERMGFKLSSVNTVKGTSQFTDAYDKKDQLQRTMLTMLFFNILIGCNPAAPAHIRMALTIAPDVAGWWDDMRLVILPFLKANEDKFFVE